MSHVKLGLVAVAAAMLLAACSTSQTSTTPPTAKPPAAASPAATATASATPAATAVAATGLTGKWNGQYSGAYQGTFTLTWRQSSSRLSGKITISNPPSTLNIHGTVSGGSIRFGTVGGVGITYTGTVSGSSMSGTYKVGLGSAASGGPWSASKS
jgi:hypothetical protein